MTRHHARHRRRRLPRMLRPAGVAIVLAGLVGAGVVTVVHGRAATGVATRPAAATSALGTAATSPAPSPTLRTTAATSATAASTRTTSTRTTTTASSRLATLVAQRSASSTSVAAVDLSTGSTVTAGATRGMTTASVVKLQLLETLLLEHQRSHTALSSSEKSAVVQMIEHSSNSAAETVFRDVGGRSEVVAHEKALGLSTSKTVPGDGDYWGLTTTSAAQQLTLLRNLLGSDSPLNASNRRHALSLMRHVESDQAWGVSAAADRHTSSAVKNGWLSVTDDDDLWAVNSVGVITADGHTVLVAVMTQHDSDYANGVTRVEKLAKAAVAAVT